MNTLFRCIRSDFYKLKHTSILFLHMLIPLLGAAIFLAYYAASSWDKATKVSAYLEALAIVFPFLIGLMSGMIVSQEEQVGNFQMMLCSTKSKCTTYLSKLITSILLGSFSASLAVGAFAFVFKTMSVVFYLKELGILIAGNIFIYILHTFISLQFGKGASTGLGIAGSLIVALMQTGMGDKIWTFIPWAWGIRFCDYLTLKQIDPSTFTIMSSQLNKGIMTMIFFICIFILASLLWFKNWEGRKSYE